MRHRPPFPDWVAVYLVFYICLCILGLLWLATSPHSLPTPTF